MTDETTTGPYHGRSRDELLPIAETMAWYHAIDLGGFVTPGTFDLRGQLDDYGFPVDLRGQRVLDVGRASGFFSFEFERRGAEVVATDLPTPLDKDFVGGPWTRAAARRKAEGSGGGAGDRGDFWLAHAVLGSRVRSCRVRIDELSPEKVGGKFDLVFAGSILNHVKAPIVAMENLLSVTSGTCVVANPIDVESTGAPRARLLGRASSGLTTWWLPNVECLVEMLHCAGFDSIDVVTPHLMLTSVDGKVRIPHAVVHARPPADAEAAIEKWRGLLR